MVSQVYCYRWELFYRKADEVVAVAVTPGPVLALAAPRVLFRTPAQTATLNWATWDVMPDGQSFLLIQDFAQPRTTLSLVQHWFEELAKP